MKYTPYHIIIPERVEILDQIKNIIIKNKLKFEIHKKLKYGGRVLETISIVINPDKKETVLISVGIHGNEPAPVYAIRDYLRRNKFPKDKRLVIVPCVVPYGFYRHIDVNENKVNINRDFFTKNPQKETKMLINLVKKYNPYFALTLHEDPDERKFFTYVQGNARKWAEKIINLVSNYIPFYKNKKIHNSTVIDGIISGSISNNTFEFFLKKKGIPNICVETPGLFPLFKRISVQTAILNELFSMV